MQTQIIPANFMQDGQGRFVQDDQGKYMQDAQGRFVNEANVHEIDKLRNDLVLGMIPKFLAMSEELKAFKETITNDIQAFLELSFERYGVKPGGKKGNVAFLSYDGRYKILRTMADYMTFDEGLLAAKDLIDQCLTDWTEGSRPELRTVIDRAFRSDREGKISISAILSLRRLEIQDDRWNLAMKAISDSLQVVYAKSYIRAYRNDENGGWKLINLDFAAL